MKLTTYLETTNQTAADFARRIGVSRQAICRYKAGRIPAGPVMERITVATGGAVTANDFFSEWPAGGPALEATP